MAVFMTQFCCTHFGANYCISGESVAKTLTNKLFLGHIHLRIISDNE